MKNSNNIEYWNLIAKYYADECNQDEKDELFKWLDEDKENHILFNQIKQDLEIININKSMNKVNVDSAWEKVKNRIQEDEQDLPEIEETKTRVLQFSSVLKYAAAIIILVSIGFFSTKVYQRISSKNLTYTYAELNEQGKEVVFPDGSTVVLNSDSKISYPKAFASNERRVTLEGEAFFDVTKNPEKPFIIELKDAEVRVLGTSFNVNTNLPGNNVEVFVKTGLVQLSRKKDGDEKILINPGDVGLLTKNSLAKSKNQNENIISWKTKEIIFRENNLTDVINTLNNVYKTNITCDDEMVLNLRYTSTFRNQEIDSILGVICLTFDLKVKYEDNKIYLIKYDS